ncbi:MAG: hypothetical protein ACO1QB_14990, partial [Verrucomicrobiales bacterium]
VPSQTVPSQTVPSQTVPSQSDKAPMGFEEKQLIPGWFFYGADLLLLLLSFAVAIGSPKPLSFGTVIFCGAAIMLGGALAVIGVLRSAREND